MVGNVIHAAYQEHPTKSYLIDQQQGSAVKGADTDQLKPSDSAGSLNADLRAIAALKRPSNIKSHPLSLSASENPQLMAALQRLESKIQLHLQKQQVRDLELKQRALYLEQKQRVLDPEQKERALELKQKQQALELEQKQGALKSDNVVTSFLITLSEYLNQITPCNYYEPEVLKYLVKECRAALDDPKLESSELTEHSATLETVLYGMEKFAEGALKERSEGFISPTPARKLWNILPNRIKKRLVNGINGEFPFNWSATAPLLRFAIEVLPQINSNMHGQVLSNLRIEVQEDQTLDSESALPSRVCKLVCVNTV